MVPMLASCGMSYNIDGSSNISGLDSKKMYLQTFSDNEIQDMDSTEIVHGRFNFSNSTESERMAFLQIDRMMIIPVVIESGDITVRINNSGTELGGTMLNVRLHDFMRVRDSLIFQANELDHEYYRAFMDGEDMAEVVEELRQQQKHINMCMDTLITSSITDNFDNVLGPGIFMISTMNQVPEMSPWITSIMSKAPDSFKNDPYVKTYLLNVEKLLNGSSAPVSSMPQAPTPNEMAKPDPVSKDSFPSAKELAAPESATKQ
jgi:hypothetical protein